MKRSTTIIMILIVMFIVIGIVYRLSHTGSPRSIDTTQRFIPTITVAPKKTNAPHKATTGSIRLSIQGQTAAFTPGDEVPVLVEATAVNAGIVGYDIVIPYNPAVISYVSARSMDDKFMLVANEKNNTLVITGIKKPEINTRVMLNKTILVELTFKALQKSKYTLSPLFGVNKTNDTNLMAESGNDIAGKVQGVEVNIGTPVTVTKESNVPIEGGLELSLSNTTTIPKNCADCMETTQLEVINGNARQAISYRLGGFAGFHDNKQEAFNTIFILTKISDDSVSLIYVPKGN